MINIMDILNSFYNGFNSLVDFAKAAMKWTLEFVFKTVPTVMSNTINPMLRSLLGMETSIEFGGDYATLKLTSTGGSFVNQLVRVVRGIDDVRTFSVSKVDVQLAHSTTLSSSDDYFKSRRSSSLSDGVQNKHEDDTDQN